MVQGGRWRSLIQVGNPATPSNETDRLSYLHRLASINSRGWYTHTKASTRVYPPLDVQRGTRLPAGNRPTNHPYICVLKGIPEYILHMLYCRLISNSMGTGLGLRDHEDCQRNGGRRTKPAGRGGRRTPRKERGSARAYTWCLTKDGAACHTLCFSPRFRVSAVRLIARSPALAGRRKVPGGTERGLFLRRSAPSDATPIVYLSDISEEFS